MDEALLEFLQVYKNTTVWVVVPGGIISGIVDAFDPLAPDVLMMRDASIQRGDEETEVGNMTIMTVQISAWGVSRER
jgi:hypothetical protein